METTEVLERALRTTEAEHGRLCPRQVLGVRMGFAALDRLEVPGSTTKRRLLIFAETDGCFVDGVAAASGCTVGHRTLRVVDYGRVAITAVDLQTRAVLRLAPRAGARTKAARYAPLDEERPYYQQLSGYRVMPDDELIEIRPVALNLDLDALLGQPGLRVSCRACGEEVINGRESTSFEGVTCPACRDPRSAYYTV